VPSTVVNLDGKLHLVIIAGMAMKAYVDAVVPDSTLAEGLSKECYPFI
jgi:hypothetical protein